MPPNHWPPSTSTPAERGRASPLSVIQEWPGAPYAHMPLSRDALAGDTKASPGVSSTARGAVFPEMSCPCALIAHRAHATRRRTMSSESVSGRVRVGRVGGIVSRATTLKMRGGPPNGVPRCWTASVPSAQRVGLAVRRGARTSLLHTNCSGMTTGFCAVSLDSIVRHSTCPPLKARQNRPAVSVREPTGRSGSGVYPTELPAVTYQTGCPSAERLLGGCRPRYGEVGPR